MDTGMNPIGKFFGLMMDSMLGPMYEEGLSNLKQVCEAETAPAEDDAASDLQPSEDVAGESTGEG